MIRPRRWSRAGLLAAALFVASSAQAAQVGERLGQVVATRIELQRRMGDWLTSALERPAEPFRVDAAVKLEIRGLVRELRAKQENMTPSVKIGGKNRVKLPGLGMVEGGGAQGNLMPEIAIDGGARVTESVSQQLETEVVKMTVLLFVDPVMPAERRDLLVRLASELVGIDRARGDEVVVEERPASADPGPPGSRTLVQATIQSPPGLRWEILIACASALGAAAILAFGLSRRGGAERTLSASLETREGARVEARSSEADAARRREEEALRARRREEFGAFKDLADATPRELVQVVAEADPQTAAAVIDLFGLGDEGLALLDATVPPQRRTEIGLELASARVVTREQLHQMEGTAREALARVRDRVPVGGAPRLAEFLSRAPSQVRRELLEAVAERDKAVAEAARKELVLFEDIPGLSDASVRQVVASVDPSIVAVALVGAPAVRDVVLNAVSKRLRSVLEVEEEVVGDKPPVEVEAARRALEDAMRLLSGRGELRTRAA